MEEKELPEHLKGEHAHLQLLLFCAIVHINQKLGAEEYRQIGTNTSHKLSSKQLVSKKVLPPHERELKAFLESLPKDLLELNVCTNQDVVETICKNRHCRAKISVHGEEPEKQYLVFKGDGNFTSSGELSTQMNESLIKTKRCKCQADNRVPINYLNWPLFLYVSCKPGLSVDTLTNFVDRTLSVGYSAEVQYTMIGVVVAPSTKIVRSVIKGKPKLRTTFLLRRGDWFACQGDKHWKINFANFKPSGSMIEVFLYSKISKSGHKFNAKVNSAEDDTATTTVVTSLCAMLPEIQDPAFNATAEKTEPDPATDEGAAKSQSNNNSTIPEDEPTKEETITVASLPSASDAYCPRDQAVLSLPNQGNSCWIAACCQLIYCAHVYSGYQAFTFHKNSLSLPVIKELHAMVENNSSWSTFYSRIFDEIPDLADYRYSQGDVGQFYEILIKYLEQHLTRKARRILFCAKAEPTKEGCHCSALTGSPDDSYAAFLQYAGGEDFTNEKEFSNQWKTCFEYESECASCGQMANQKGYFTHWAHFLFVITTSSVSLIRNAIDFPFTIGTGANQATYEVIGAAVHSGTNAGGHYTAVVKNGSEWRKCNDGRSFRINREDITGDVQLMLFKRRSSFTTSQDDNSTNNTVNEDQPQITETKYDEAPSDKTVQKESKRPHGEEQTLKQEEQHKEEKRRKRKAHH